MTSASKPDMSSTLTSTVSSGPLASKRAGLSWPDRLQVVEPNTAAVVLVFVGSPSCAGGRYHHDMGEAALDLELVVSADRELTVPASELRRLAALPGQRVRV